MLNHYLKILLCFAVVFLSVSVSGKEKTGTEKSDDDVIELQVSPQMRDRVKQAFERGKVFDEGDVTVVELDEENSAGTLSQNDDAIVIAPPEDRSTQSSLGDTLKSAVSPAPVMTVKEDIPQKVVVIENVIHTRYVAGRRTVVVGRPVRICPRGRRIRYRVHYFPVCGVPAGARGCCHRVMLSSGKKRHHAVPHTAMKQPGRYKVSAQRGRSVSCCRPRIVIAHKRVPSPQSRTIPGRKKTVRDFLCITLTKS